MAANNSSRHSQSKDNNYSPNRTADDGIDLISDSAASQKMFKIVEVLHQLLLFVLNSVCVIVVCSFDMNMDGIHFTLRMGCTRKKKNRKKKKCIMYFFLL